MNLDDFRLIKLEPTTSILPFDCGNSDLNEFLLNDAKHYADNLLAVTYLLETDVQTIAFFSALNDKISVQDVSNSRWKKFKKAFPAGKQFKSYPAVKIGRFAVDQSYNGKGLGTALLDYIKVLFITNNRTGCNYITVDAYKKSIPFYQKNDFIFLTEIDRSADTRLMYFELKRLV